MAEANTDTNPIELATELTIAWLSNPNTKAEAGDVASVLRQMHEAVQGLGQPAPEPEPEAPQYTPAVTARKSLASKDHIISMIDGKPYKTLRRHLSRHGLTPEDYRARYGLKPDYPMVSESYSLVRRDMAKKIGLGRKPGQSTKSTGKPTAPGKSARKPAATQGQAAPKAGASRGRPKKTDAPAA